jgi:hypothetical protein
MENQEYQEGGDKQGRAAPDQDAPETQRKQSPGREESSEGITGQQRPGQQESDQGSGRETPRSGQTPREDEEKDEPGSDGA